MTVEDRKTDAEAGANALELRAQGRAFYVSTLADYDLSAAELLILEQVCRQLDTLEALRDAVQFDGTMIRTNQGQRPHPALSEIRQLQLALARCVAQLALPDPTTGDATVQTLTTSRAKRAASKRWTP